MRARACAARVPMAQNTKARVRVAENHTRKQRIKRFAGFVGTFVSCCAHVEIMLKERADTIKDITDLHMILTWRSTPVSTDTFVSTIEHF